MHIFNAEGSHAINKPCGRYITCSLPDRKTPRRTGQAAAVIANELTSLLPNLHGRTLLLAGLGNESAVPDSLGPAVVAASYATRQIFDHNPPLGLERLCTIAPGVLGMSGIETAEILRGICDRLSPAAVIAVDALAAASISRVGTTVQLSDSGIAPGSGVGSGRASLNQETLGCPVVAIGVPTVVDTSAIVSETIDALRQYWLQQTSSRLPELDDKGREYIEQSLLASFQGRLMVTPRDIDDLIADMAELLAAAIAICVHPACNESNYFDFIK